MVLKYIVLGHIVLKVDGPVILETVSLQHQWEKHIRCAPTSNYL